MMLSTLYNFHVKTNVHNMTTYEYVYKITKLHMNVCTYKIGNWTQDEDKILIQLQKVYGNQWTKIAKRLPHRTDSSIKVHTHTHIYIHIHTYIRTYVHEPL